MTNFGPGKAPFHFSFPIFLFSWLSYKQLERSNLKIKKYLRILKIQILKQFKFSMVPGTKVVNKYLMTWNILIVRALLGGTSIILRKKCKINFMFLLQDLKDKLPESSIKSWKFLSDCVNDLMMCLCTLIDIMLIERYSNSYSHWFLLWARKVT